MAQSQLAMQLWMLNFTVIFQLVRNLLRYSWDALTASFYQGAIHIDAHLAGFYRNEKWENYYSYTFA